MNVFAKFDEIPSMTLQDIKETKRYGHTFVRSFVGSFRRTDNVKTVYPPTNTVCGGYSKNLMQFDGDSNHRTLTFSVWKQNKWPNCPRTPFSPSAMEE